MRKKRKITGRGRRKHGKIRQRRSVGRLKMKRVYPLPESSRFISSRSLNVVMSAEIALALSKYLKQAGLTGCDTTMFFDREPSKKDNEFNMSVTYMEHMESRSA